MYISNFYNYLFPVKYFKHEILNLLLLSSLRKTNTFHGDIIQMDPLSKSLNTYTLVCSTYSVHTPLIQCGMTRPLSVCFLSPVSFFLFLFLFFFFVTPILMFPSYNNIIYIILRVSHPILERLVLRCTSIFELRSHAKDVFPDETERAHFFALQHSRTPHKTVVIASRGVALST